MQHLQMNNHMRGSSGEVGVFNLYSDLFFEAAGLALVPPCYMVVNPLVIFVAPVPATPMLRK